MTMDPGHLDITNKWNWTDEVVDITPSSTEEDTFLLVLKKGKGYAALSSPHRS